MDHMAKDALRVSYSLTRSVINHSYGGSVLSVSDYMRAVNQAVTDVCNVVWP
jgi:hypothetical protein